VIQINLTLFVQIVNIVITYKVLTRYLLQPIMDRLIERHKEEKKLSDEIILKQKDVEIFLKEKTDQLSQFQKDATSDYPYKPAQREPFLFDKDESAQEGVITSEAYETLKKNISKRLYDVEHK